MVVLVLIGIMAALIIPEMKGTFEDALLRSTARKLVSAFNLAASQAVTVNQLHRVRLDRKAGRYILERASSEDWSAGVQPARRFIRCETYQAVRATLTPASPSRFGDP